MEDRRLIRRARRGDGVAFAELVRRYERSMYALARSTVRSEWDAADAVQEAFAEAFEHLRQLRDPDRFRPWLSRIVLNKCNESFRKGSRLVVVEEPPELPVPADAVSREEWLDLLSAVRRLDDEHRNTVALRYFCDLKLEDVAEVLGCPVGTVKSRLNRALGKLQTTLGAADAESLPLNVQEVAR